MTQSNIKLASYFIARSFRRIIICILAVHNYNWRTEHFSLIQDQSGSFSAMAHSSSGSINSSNNMWWCRSFGVFWRQLELHWRCLIGERGRPWPWVWTLAPWFFAAVRPTDRLMTVRRYAAMAPCTIDADPRSSALDTESSKILRMSS